MSSQSRRDRLLDDVDDNDTHSILNETHDPRRTRRDYSQPRDLMLGSMSVPHSESTDINHRSSNTYNPRAAPNEYPVLVNEDGVFKFQTDGLTNVESPYARRKQRWERRSEQYPSKAGNEAVANYRASSDASQFNSFRHQDSTVVPIKLSPSDSKHRSTSPLPPPRSASTRLSQSYTASASRRNSQIPSEAMPDAYFADLTISPAGDNFTVDDLPPPPSHCRVSPVPFQSYPNEHLYATINSDKGDSLRRPVSSVYETVPNGFGYTDLTKYLDMASSESRTITPGPGSLASEDFSARTNELPDHYPVARPRTSKAQQTHTDKLNGNTEGVGDTSREPGQRWTVLKAKPKKRDTHSLPSDVMLEEPAVN